MHPLATLEFSTRVAKRAQYEAIEISWEDSPLRIRNASHADPSEHEYEVTMTDGVPVACTCPADKRFDGACKHRVAVAIEAGSEASPSTTESARLMTQSGAENDTDADARADSDETAELSTADDTCPDCRPGFPCWDCYREQKREFR